MKNYIITVNGNTYEVTVEEKNGGNFQTQYKAPAALNQAPIVPPKATAPKAPAEAMEGTPVKSSVPGKVFKIEKKAGEEIKKGENILILEAMKMEIPVVSPDQGTLVSINVSLGDTVESGDVLATIK